MGSLDEILKDIQKKTNLRIGSASDVIERVVGLTTGNLAIDHIIGVGGLPLGRSVELYGLESSGKTTTALQTAAALQQDILANNRDEFILYLDFEHALDPDYCEALGLDINHDSFILAQPRSMEQGAEGALRVIESGKIRLVIWDSVAAMAPLSRLEGDFDQRTAAMNKARLMSGLMLQLTPLLHHNNTCSVFINHLMEAVEMTGRPGLPPKATTPGGRGLKYYASVRLEYRQLKNIKGKAADALAADDTDQAIATHVKVKCVKNKVASPFREAEVRVRYGKGFDNFWSALQVLTAYKVVVAGSGGYYYFDEAKGLDHPKMDRSATGRPNVRGEPNLLAFADEHPDWRDKAIDTAVAYVQDYGDQADLGEVSEEPT